MHIPKSIRWLTLLTLLYALLSSAAIYGARRGEGFCLLIYRDKQQTILNPNSSSTVSFIHTQRIPQNASFLVDGKSPDGSYESYIFPYDPAASHFSLFLLPLDNRLRPQPILIAGNIPVQAHGTYLYTAWSPDSHQLAYEWQDGNSQWSVTIASPNDEKQSLSFDGNNDVWGLGWSADSAYYAFGVQHKADAKRRLHFWSSATRKFISTSFLLPTIDRENPAFSGYDMTAWSPHGHNIAFLSPGDKGAMRLIMTTPEGDEPLTFDFATELVEPRFNWSPSGAYLALSHFPNSDKPNSRQWHVSVFGIDGTSYVDLSHIVLNLTGSRVPQVLWSINRDLLVFQEGIIDSSKNGPYKGRLIAYDPASQHTRILAEATDVFRFATPGKRLTKVRRLENGKNLLGMVDIVSGQRYEFLEEELSGMKDLVLSPDEQLVITVEGDNGQLDTKLKALDAAWTVEMPKSTGIGPIWSPDSTLFYFSQKMGNETEISIYQRNGTLFYQGLFMNVLDIYTVGPRWIPCGQRP